MRILEFRGAAALAACLVLAAAADAGRAQVADTSGVAPAPAFVPAPPADTTGVDTMRVAGYGTGAERWTLARCISTALTQSGDSRAARAHRACPWRGPLG